MFHQNYQGFKSSDFKKFKTHVEQKDLDWENSKIRDKN